MAGVPIDKKKPDERNLATSLYSNGEILEKVTNDAMKQAGAPNYRWLIIYLVVLPVLLLYLLILILPLDFGSPTIPAAGCFTLLFLLPVKISHDTQLLLIAILAGGLGSYIHAVTSFTSYVGNRTLRRSWEPWYYMRPIMGSVLALIFYFLIIGGFLLLVAGGTKKVSDFSAYGIAGLSSLVGMFSKQATDKMREVFDSLFKATGDNERSDKLEDKRFVERDMIRRPEIAGYELKDKDRDALGSIKLKDLNQLVGARVTRIPIFASDGSLCCLLHKSLIYEYMAKTAIEAAEANPPSVPDYDHLTLSNVLDSEKDRVTIRETLAFVAPGSTIGEAKAAMQRIDGCQDVFVTDRGDRNGKVIGWLTNGIITRAITSG